MSLRKQAWVSWSRPSRSVTPNSAPGAKELAYKENFYSGVMTVGNFKGEGLEAGSCVIDAMLRSQNAPLQLRCEDM